MPAPRLLLVEDDRVLSELLEYRLKGEGYAVTVTANGDEALKLAVEGAPDMVILDWMIEGTSGIDVCRLLRRDKGTAHLAIIMLTARDAEAYRILGLEAGADDYITKPFSPRELMARIATVMRRIHPAQAGQSVSVGDLSLYSSERRVTRRGKTVTLGPTEFRLLEFLMEHPGRVFSREQLLAAVWGSRTDVEQRTVDVHIRRLRTAIAIDGAPDPIRTVRSAGYAFEAV